MPIEFEVQEPITAPGTGWTGFNTPHSSNVGQTHGPAGMGIGAYMNRPETQPGFKPFTIPRPGYNSAVGTSMQTDGPAGMGMRPYMNRPETQPGFKPFTPPSEFNRMGGRGITNPKEIGLPAIQYRAGLKDWMKDKAWPWMKETGEGMKNQIPYLLDNLIPGYEPPEGYYEPDWEENKDMVGLEENDLFHLMQNGYTLEEAQQILNEQIGDGSFEMAELGLPATMDWQTDPYEKLTLDELINLGASEDQIVEYLGLV